MKNAIDIIEHARSYYLHPDDHKTPPILVGGRIRLELALQGIKSDMILATYGNKKKCIVLIDFDAEEVWALIQKADRKIIKIKALKAKN